MTTPQQLLLNSLHVNKCIEQYYHVIYFIFCHLGYFYFQIYICIAATSHLWLLYKQQL